ncbi:MAG: hypothetical protein P8H03_08055, partial [Emcibacteraceae bacterium]|nr:hypothetical protein [Emcibacteraceae bacterium]
FVIEVDSKELTIENISYKVYGPDHLQNYAVNEKPVIIIASMYLNEIEKLLNEIGYKINEDYVY